MKLVPDSFTSCSRTGSFSPWPGGHPSFAGPRTVDSSSTDQRRQLRRYGGGAGPDTSVTGPARRSLMESLILAQDERWRRA